MNQLEADAKQNDSKCVIENGGSVNCSSSVYEDEQSWKKSRHHVDLLIQTLKQKITALKDIRRHLRENKPKNIADHENDSIENASEAVSSEEMNVSKGSIEVGANVKPPKQVTDTNKQNRRNKVTPTKENDADAMNKSIAVDVSGKANRDGNIVATTIRTISRKASEQENRRVQHQRGQESRPKNMTRTTKASSILKIPPKLAATTTTAPIKRTTGTTTTTMSTPTTTKPTPANEAKLTPTGKTVDSGDESNVVLSRNVSSSLQSIVSTNPKNEEHTTIPYEKPDVDEQSRTECYCEPDSDEK